jgi:dTMP kinase
MPGLFITFEGGEGSGKTTQLKALLAALRGSGAEVVETRDPGGTAVGKQIRELLLDREQTRMEATAELFLYEASRAQLVAEVIRPSLDQGRVVLCDRFCDSTVAYQGYGRGLDRGLIGQLNAVATGGVAPDLTFLLDLDPALGLERATQRGLQLRQRQDRMERELLAFHQRVRDGYRAIAMAEPARVVVVDGARGMTAIEGEIRRRVEAILGATARGCRRERLPGGTAPSSAGG